MFKRIIILINFVLSASFAMAINIDSLNQIKEVREPLPPHEVTVKGGISVGDESTTSLEIDYAWYPLRYAGIGIGLEFDTKNDHPNYFRSEDEYESYEYDPEYIKRFNFHPTLAFRTPILYLKKGKDRGLMLQCKPGLVISVPRNFGKYVDKYEGPYDSETMNRIGGVLVERQHWKNKGGKLMFWRIQSAIGYGSSGIQFSLGYSLSNYNIMSCRNNLYYKGKLMEKIDNLSLTHTVFISISALF